MHKQRGKLEEGQRKGNAGLQLRSPAPQPSSSLVWGFNLVHATWLACLLSLGNASIAVEGEEARGRNQQILLRLAFLARLALAQRLYKKKQPK